MYHVVFSWQKRHFFIIIYNLSTHISTLEQGTDGLMGLLDFYHLRHPSRGGVSCPENTPIPPPPPRVPNAILGELAQQCVAQKFTPLTLISSLVAPAFGVRARATCLPSNRHGSPAHIRPRGPVAAKWTRRPRAELARRHCLPQGVSSGEMIVPIMAFNLTLSPPLH